MHRSWPALLAAVDLFQNNMCTDEQACMEMHGVWAELCMISTTDATPADEFQRNESSLCSYKHSCHAHYGRVCVQGKAVLYMQLIAWWLGMGGNMKRAANADTLEVCAPPLQAILPPDRTHFSAVQAPVELVPVLVGSVAARTKLP